MDSSQNQQSYQMDSETNDKVVKALRDLAEINHTAHQGYSTAAEGIKNAEYASLFRSYSDQRHTFEHELESYIQRLGGSVDGNTAMGVISDAAGALHRGWINIKSAVTGGGIEALLDECQRGDEAAVAAYQQALEAPLPQDVAAVVRQQYHSVQEAYSRVKGLARIEA